MKVILKNQVNFKNTFPYFIKGFKNFVNLFTVNCPHFTLINLVPNYWNKSRTFKNIVNKTIEAFSNNKIKNKNNLCSKSLEYRSNFIHLQTNNL